MGVFLWARYLSNPAKFWQVWPVHLIITMIKWIRTSRLSINNSLFWQVYEQHEKELTRSIYIYIYIHTHTHTHTHTYTYTYTRTHKHTNTHTHTHIYSVRGPSNPREA